ncbi:hypothetical protein D3C80_1992930 [compost metagenome]
MSNVFVVLVNIIIKFTAKHIGIIIAAIGDAQAAAAAAGQPASITVKFKPNLSTIC